MSDKPVYYLDACIFLTYLKNENKIQYLLEGVKKLFDDFGKNKCIIVTSTITKIEVMPHESRPEADKILDGIFKRSNFQWIEAGIKVVELARKLRIHCRDNDNFNLFTPDAIHLASAIIYQSKTFYTTDGCKKDGQKVKLLGLSDHEIFRGLTIETPIANQQDIFILDK